MKRKIVMMAVLLVMGNVFSGYAAEADDEAYIMGDISTLAANFALNVSVSGDNGPIVDKLATFRVNLADGNAASGMYDISIFKDGSFISRYPQKSLPFSLKRNYRGTRDGDYQITFVAKDKTGKIGKGSVTIQVRHQ